jgi:hypothetical protein
MPEPPEHNPSGFEEPAAGGEGAGAGRFWQQYGSARGGRTGTRNGGSERRTGQSEVADQHECLDWCPICRGAEVVRATTPPELREQWQAVQRDALVMVRALIDAYLERLGDGSRHRAARPVEDIPIE